MGISIADFTGNGLMDIFIANDTEANFLFIIKETEPSSKAASNTGLLTTCKDAAFPEWMDAKDFDNDGWVDILYNDLKGEVFGIFRNDGGKSFSDETWSTKLGALTRGLSGWEHRVLRLQQRWLERRLFRQWRCGQPQRVFQTA